VSYEDDYDDDDLWDDERYCTRCGGSGWCEDEDPLGDCPEPPHRCHECGGSGNQKDQVIF
jgi:DnaJ-class molecular chaperone